MSIEAFFIVAGVSRCFDATGSVTHDKHDMHDMIPVPLFLSWNAAAVGEECWTPLYRMPVCVGAGSGHVTHDRNNGHI